MHGITMKEDDKDTRLDKQMQFILEADKLKQIGRQTYLHDKSRKENDAEHSWHLALMALLLSEYANEEIDTLHVMAMVLIHDLVEIDAGDTYAYDEEAHKTKREREEKAAERIFTILPKEQAEYVRGLWDEFEQGETMEAKFAHTLDNMQPLMLNHASGGLAWRERGIKREQVEQRNRITKEGSTELWNYAKKILDENVNKGNLQ